MPKLIMITQLEFPYTIIIITLALYKHTPYGYNALNNYIIRRLY